MEKKGISICESWRKDFECFFNDMGLKPNDGSQLKRKDVKKGYFKENCFWSY